MSAPWYWYTLISGGFTNYWKPARVGIEQQDTQ